MNRVLVDLRSIAYLGTKLKNPDLRMPSCMGAAIDKRVFLNDSIHATVTPAETSLFNLP